MPDRLKSPLAAPEQKASRTAHLCWRWSAAASRAGRRVIDSALAREGYLGSAIVHRCVRLIAENAAACRHLVYDGARERDGHPLLAIADPLHARQDGASFSRKRWWRTCCWPAMAMSKRRRSMAWCASFMRRARTASS
ncbi:MAG: phage portal protein [Rhodopseudomonas palustris]|nr:phage portal protein [Rhodopseudomonas palustris]